MAQRPLGIAAALAALALGLLGATNASAQPRTLRIGNWLPSHHLIPRGIIEPWARAIEKETNGELKFEVMTSSLGSPPQYFDLLLDAAVDVGKERVWVAAVHPREPAGRGVPASDERGDVEVGVS